MSSYLLGCNFILAAAKIAACRDVGWRHAGTLGVPGRGAEAGRDEGRAGMWAHRAGPRGWRCAWPMGQRRAKTWGEGRPDQWGGGVPGQWGGGVPGRGVCLDVGWRCAGTRDPGRAGMRGGGMPCYTGTSGVPGCRAEACRPDGVGGVVVGGWFLTCLHDGPVVGVRLSRSSVGLAVGLDVLAEIRS